MEKLYIECMLQKLNNIQLDQIKYLKHEFIESLIYTNIPYNICGEISRVLNNLIYSMEEKKVCVDCKKRDARKHFDQGLNCGDDLCDECFDKMVNNCRQRSW